MATPPSTTLIKPETKDGLDSVVSKFYKLLKEGKGPGTPEGDAALKEMDDFVDDHLEYDPTAETWVDKT
jgi:hypothetical protein